MLHCLKDGCVIVTVTKTAKNLKGRLRFWSSGHFMVDNNLNRIYLHAKSATPPWIATLS